MRETIRRLGTVNAQPRAGVSHVGDGLERWQSEHYGMASQAGNGRKVQRLRSPRGVKGGWAHSQAWEAALYGKAAGHAYLVDGSWQWLAYVDCGDFTVALSESADGERTTTKYALSDPEVTEAETYLSEHAAEIRDCPTPNGFALLLNPDALPAPVVEPEPTRLASAFLMAEPEHTQTLEELHLRPAAPRPDAVATLTAQIAAGLIDVDRQIADLQRRRALALEHLEAARAALA